MDRGRLHAGPGLHADHRRAAGRPRRAAADLPARPGGVHARLPGVRRGALGGGADRRPARAGRRGRPDGAAGAGDRAGDVRRGGARAGPRRVRRHPRPRLSGRAAARRAAGRGGPVRQRLARHLPGQHPGRAGRPRPGGARPAPRPRRPGHRARPARRRAARRGRDPGPPAPGAGARVGLALVVVRPAGRVRTGAAPARRPLPGPLPERRDAPAGADAAGEPVLRRGARGRAAVLRRDRGVLPVPGAVPAGRHRPGSAGDGPGDAALRRRLDPHRRRRRAVRRPGRADAAHLRCGRPGRLAGVAARRPRRRPRLLGARPAPAGRWARPRPDRPVADRRRTGRGAGAGRRHGGRSADDRQPDRQRRRRRRARRRLLRPVRRDGLGGRRLRRDPALPDRRLRRRRPAHGAAPGPRARPRAAGASTTAPGGVVEVRGAPEPCATAAVSRGPGRRTGCSAAGGRR